MAELNAGSSSLYFSTYLGGSSFDEATGIAVNALGNAAISGHTASTNFPLANARQTTYGGGDSDAFVTEIHVSPISLSSTWLTFADQNLGTTSSSQTVTVTNNGQLPLTITGVTLTGTNSSDFTETNTCASTISAGKTCTITVTFAPTAEGPMTATLNVAASSSGSPPQIVGLSGTGSAPVVVLLPASLNFGNQQVNTTSAIETVTLSNTGNNSLGSISISITGANANQFQQTNNCGASIAAGTSCAINVTFTPTATGTRTATLTVNDYATNTPQTVRLTGTGAVPPPSLSPTSLAFTSQNVGTTSAPQPVALQNSTSSSVSISSIAFTGANSADYAQTNNCGTSLAAGSNCTINVTFTPTAAGTRTATLTVTDSASNSPQTASLTGTGASSSASGLAVVQVQNNITDSAGQTWAETSSGYANESDTGPRSGMFYTANSAAVTSVTVHFSTSGGVIKPGLMVMEISGAVSSAVADGSVNHASLASVTTSSSGSLTTTNANDILIFATDTSGDETGWTAGTSYTIPNNQVMTGASGSKVRQAMQFAIVSSALTNATTSMTYKNSNWNGNSFAAFK